MSSLIIRKRLAWGLGIAFALMPLAWVSARQAGQEDKFKYPDLTGTTPLERRGDAGPLQKLSPDLRMLYGQLATPSRGGEALRLSGAQLAQMFNVPAGESNPLIGVTLTVTPGTRPADLNTNGVKVFWRTDKLLFAEAPVRALGTLADNPRVLSIEAAKAVNAPPFPKADAAPKLELPTRGAPAPRSATQPDNEFNAQSLTGKGVIIGIVDTGIDWRHEDFIRPDGTSRVLALWDQFDNSYAESQGKIGQAPPVLSEGVERAPGTIYLGEQINAALKGKGAVASMDYNGHGTACAGTAAGNGRASAPTNPIRGVAPEADLLIVKVGDCAGLHRDYILGTLWIAQMARSLKRPAVINHSLGRHLSSHLGDEDDEAIMNELTGAGKPGLAITVAAGNEAQASLHAAGRFGPRRPGQEDIESTPVELVVSAERTENATLLDAYFDPADEWGLAIKSVNGALTDDAGQGLLFYLVKAKDRFYAALPKGAKEPKFWRAYAEKILDLSELAEGRMERDTVRVPLPPGTYLIVGFGASDKVKSGAFDLYLPRPEEASFTRGAVKKQFVGSPGNAANVITVGAYDFRASWLTRHNAVTRYNLLLGQLSHYSNSGGPRGTNIYKPEIVAPATYTLSALSQATTAEGSACKGLAMVNDLNDPSVTADGKHVAWSGTSAAAPFTAGVIALMLQKNPTLDGAQIKSILTKTAIRGDQFVGATPNSEWGYGKLNPAAALAATPAARSARRAGK